MFPKLSSEKISSTVCQELWKEQKLGYDACKDEKREWASATVTKVERINSCSLIFKNKQCRHLQILFLKEELCF